MDRTQSLQRRSNMFILEYKSIFKVSYLFLHHLGNPSPPSSSILPARPWSPLSIPRDISPLDRVKLHRYAVRSWPWTRCKNVIDSSHALCIFCRKSCKIDFSIGGVICRSNATFRLFRFIFPRRNYVKRKAFLTASSASHGMPVTLYLDIFMAGCWSEHGTLTKFHFALRNVAAWL